jgi:hypothetical protein
MPGEIFYFLTAGDAPGIPVDRIYRGPLRADGFDKVSNIAAGLDRDWICLIVPVGPIELVGSDPTVLAFTGDEILSGSIWAGKDGPEIATITGAWIDAPTGYCRWSLSADQADLLSAGNVYNLRLQVAATDDDGTRNFPVHDGLVRVLPSPGGTAPSYGPAYCTADDVDNEAPWSPDERSEFSTTAGWKSEIDRASRWVDSVILSRAKLGRIAPGGWPGDPPLNMARPWDIVLLPSVDWTSDIQEALDDGRMETGDVRLVRATALYALSLIRAYKMDAADRMAYRKAAAMELLAFQAKLDLDDDATYETVVTA